MIALAIIGGAAVLVFVVFIVCTAIRVMGGGGD